MTIYGGPTEGLTGEVSFAWSALDVVGSQIHDLKHAFGAMHLHLLTVRDSLRRLAQSESSESRALDAVEQLARSVDLGMETVDQMRRSIDPRSLRGAPASVAQVNQELVRWLQPVAVRTEREPEHDDDVEVWLTGPDYFAINAALGSVGATRVVVAWSLTRSQAVLTVRVLTHLHALSRALVPVALSSAGQLRWGEADGFAADSRPSTRCLEVHLIAQQGLVDDDRGQP